MISPQQYAGWAIVFLFLLWAALKVLNMDSKHQDYLRNVCAKCAFPLLEVDNPPRAKYSYCTNPKCVMRPA